MDIDQVSLQENKISKINKEKCHEYNTKKYSILNFYSDLFKNKDNSSENICIDQKSESVLLLNTLHKVNENPTINVSDYVTNVDNLIYQSDNKQEIIENIECKEIIDVIKNYINEIYNEIEKEEIKIIIPENIQCEQNFHSLLFDNNSISKESIRKEMPKIDINLFVQRIKDEDEISVMDIGQSVTKDTFDAINNNTVISTSVNSAAFCINNMNDKTIDNNNFDSQFVKYNERKQFKAPRNQITIGNKEVCSNLNWNQILSKQNIFKSQTNQVSKINDKVSQNEPPKENLGLNKNNCFNKMNEYFKNLNNNLSDFEQNKKDNRNAYDILNRSNNKQEMSCSENRKRKSNIVCFYEINSKRINK